MPAEIVQQDGDLPDALSDKRIACILIGPGLGRGDGARHRLEAALTAGPPLVIDADALVLIRRGDSLTGAILTPHAGELDLDVALAELDLNCP